MVIFLFCKSAAFGSLGFQTTSPRLNKAVSRRMSCVVWAFRALRGDPLRGLAECRAVTMTPVCRRLGPSVRQAQLQRARSVRLACSPVTRD